MPKEASRRPYRRSARLETVLRASRLKESFKKKGWTALRRFECTDLFGFYDFNVRIESHAKYLANAIRTGAYQRQQGLSLEITKSDLLVRRIQLPHPDEATIMTAIADHLEPLIKARQPSKKAYYGRSDEAQRGIHLIVQAVVYPWYKLWPQYQEHILSFAKRKKLVVTTDIQNFFDSINTEILRNQLAAIIGDTGLPDFIIFLFENFAVRDHYAPARSLGIPTLKSDLPRLVAHCLLFEIDSYLERVTDSCYSRWVDDMNFGVADRTEARKIIRDVERLLFRRGLRLGGSKTVILDRDGVSKYIQEDENQFLNTLLNEKRRKTRALTRVESKKLVRRFFRYRSQPFAAYREKVLRRYYNAFGLRRPYRIPLLGEELRRIYEVSKTDFRQHPDTRFRESIARFWLTLNPTAARLTFLMNVAIGSCSYDDVVTAAILQGIAEMTVPKKLYKGIWAYLSPRLKFLRPGGFYGAASILCKYGAGREILDFVQRSFGYWSSHELLTRQIVALWAVLPDGKTRDEVLRYVRNSRGGTMEPLIRFVGELQSVTVLSGSLKWSLPPDLKSERFELYRAVLANSVSRSAALDVNQRKRLQEAIRAKVRDSRMRDIALAVA